MKKNVIYLFFCILTLTSGILSAQKTQKTDSNKAIDSLLQFLKTLTSSSPELKPIIEGESAGLHFDTIKINTLNAISGQYIDIGSYDQALDYAQQAKRQGEKLIPSYSDSIGNYFLKRGIGSAYNLIGLIYWNQSNYERGMNNLLEALKYYVEIGNKKGIANCFNSMGLIYLDQGIYDKGIASLLKALKIRESIGDKGGISSSLLNIGNVYIKQNNYENALKYYLQALKMSKAAGNLSREAKILTNIGLIYSEWHNYVKALEYCLPALKIREDIGDKRGIANSYNNIGDIYLKMTNSDSLKNSLEINCKKALDNFFKALTINEEIGNVRSATINYINIGNVFLKQNKFEESTNFAVKSLSLSKKIGYKEGIKEAYFTLSELFEKKGDYKKAFEYHNLFTRAKDSLHNEKSSQQIAELNTRYDSEKKEKEIQLLNKEKENQANITAVEHRKQMVILFSVSGFSLLLMGFAMVVFRSFRQKQLLNRELEKLSIVASETDNGVLICGPNGELEWSNAGFKRLSGYSFEEFKQVGNTLEEVSANPEIKNLIRQSIENKKSAVYQSLNTAKDGSALWTQSTLTPILDEKGNIKNLVVIDIDVSERKKIEEKLIGQNAELEERTIEIAKQKKLVEERNLKIIDSITYAQLIQQSILMEESEIREYLPDSFIYYKPKDIVSGDFYWFSKVDNKIILAAIDCTGHGVPGAFMSMIGNTLLNQIVNEKHYTKPSEILHLLHFGIYEALHQQKGGVLSHDGMDIALCSIDYKTNEVHYAGAQNPLYVIWNNSLEVVKADMHTIGGGGNEATGFDPLERTYTNHIIPIKKGMSIYLFSDGYMDQFGDNNRKKFGIQQFKNLLLENQHLNMGQQKEEIVTALENWKGATSQIDDVLVMGLRL